jgi:DNA-binding SARP family transcriptional activator
MSIQGEALDRRPAARGGPVYRPVSVRLLGGLDVRLHAEPVSFPTRHAALIFAYLASDPGTPRLRSHLAALFWADRGEEQARGSLRQTLFRIRKVFAGLDPQVLEADARMVAVNPEVVSCDVAAVLRDDHGASQAVDGVFLDGWDGVGPDFDLWIGTMRRSIAEAAHRMLEAEAGRAEQSGDVSALIDAARRMAAADPYDEVAGRMLMTGLALSGQPAAAADFYRRLAARLATELDAEPAAETRALAAQISARQGRFSGTNVTARPSDAVASAQSGDMVRERRQVTILVCWMELDDGDAAEPEGFARFRRDIHEPLRATIARFGGTMDRAPGMICMGWFGWPTPLEDAASRAVRAALAIVSLACCRVGIATSDMLVEPGFDPVGAAPDIAMKLAAAGRPGDILVSPATAALVGQGFEFRASPTVEASSLLGPKAAPARFAARLAHRTIGLVGRAAENDLLHDRLRRAEQGEGQTVIVTGEAGIGKSHLQELLAGSAGRLDARRALLQCLPTDTATSFKPVIDHLAIAAGLADIIDAEARGRRLEAHLEEAGVIDPQAVAAIATMMGLRPPDTGQAPPAERRRTLLASLIAYFSGGGDAWLYYIAVEDIHWADASTLELIAALIDIAPTLRLFIIATARPDFGAGSLSGRNLTTLSLSPLSRAETLELIAAQQRGPDLPAGVADDIASQADGIPLHVEELVRWYGEQGKTGQTPETPVPPSLRAALQARLAVLGAHRRVAQRAACIGRQFPRNALVAACSRDASEVDAAIEAMRDAGMIFRYRGTSGDDFIFRHALVCEAAYESLDDDERRETHLRLYRYFSNASGTPQEVAAWHAARAGRHDVALRIYKGRGAAALADFAHEEARNHFENALEQVTRLPLTEEFEDERLDIKGRLSLCYAHGYGYSHPETVRHLEDARRLALSRPTSPFTIPILWQTYSLHYTHADGDLARAVGAELLSLSHWNDDYGPQDAVAHRFIAAGDFLMGRFMDAERHFSIARKALTAPGAPNSLAAMGVDQLVPAGMLHARVLAVLGREDDAMALITESLDTALRTGQVQPLITAHVLAGQTLLILADWVQAGEHAEKALGLLTDHPGAMWQAYARCIAGLARLRGAGDPDGVALYGAGAQVLRESQTRASTTFFDALLADSLAELGRADEACRVFEDLEGRVSSGIEPWCHVEVMRLDLACSGVTGRHKADFEDVRLRALELAQSQGAALWLDRLSALAPSPQGQLE